MAGMSRVLNELAIGGPVRRFPQTIE